jgi:hypothetical protein
VPGKQAAGRPSRPSGLLSGNRRPGRSAHVKITYIAPGMTRRKQHIQLMLASGDAEAERCHDLYSCIVERMGCRLHPWFLDDLSSRKQKKPAGLDIVWECSVSSRLPPSIQAPRERALLITLKEKAIPRKVGLPSAVICSLVLVLIRGSYGSVNATMESLCGSSVTPRCPPAAITKNCLPFFLV